MTSLPMIRLTDDELARRALDDARLNDALRTLRDLGFVVLENALPRERVAEWNALADAELFRVFGPDQEAVRRANGHCGVGFPMRPPFLDPEFVANPFATQILRGAMGETVFSYLPYGTNTAWPGSGVQHTHRDTGHLFPGTPHILPMTIAVVNIPLINFTVENGATEVWPGSHLVPDIEPDYRERIEERAERFPSVRMVVPAGSLIVRDLRCWHRGMPNRTNKPRSMIALVYFRQLHHLPDTLSVGDTLPNAVWNALSDDARRIFRYHPVES